MKSSQTRLARSERRQRCELRIVVCGFATATVIRNGIALVLTLIAGLTEAPARAQQLDASCTVTVNGQTVRVNPDGSFGISNVAAPDVFGAGGPGTTPDFLSDDF
ncbi:MAG TPA: hypothetical protein VGM03_02705, partial [Phycisphaerae bacterium]